MAESSPLHSPVMLSEILTLLAPRGGAVYLDATFGVGGYAKALLEAAPCTVIGVDRDPAACARGALLAEQYSDRLLVLQGRFTELSSLLPGHGFDRVDGVAFDLGVSSPQLDDPSRGFSFRSDGPLDMRMDPTTGSPAADMVNDLPEAELARIIALYGEERAARRIARAIVRTRSSSPITSTLGLAETVRSVLPRAADGIDPATRTFQALRIHVNDELAELDNGLTAAEHLLAPGGRLCVVSFHSLEDRAVKLFLRKRSGLAPRPSRHQPEAIDPLSVKPTFRLITSRPLRPSQAEVSANPRARSARLRAAERTSAPVAPPPEYAASGRKGELHERLACLHSTNDRL
ncbi:MAG: 16S rRNA (cytosine(1402)-N(4))-methyltransferase RsmH [Rhodospirillales bacterium]|nr:16S rRNA (cytosine(1402)-N(4))-methyltransferase RsmH [Rhodospirillales bacterium]